VTLERDTSAVLRYGAAAGIAVVAAGLLMDLIGASDIGGNVMIAGVAMIVLTPLAGMIVSFASLSSNGERGYALSALALITITVIGMLITFLLI
jgi:uncharacterized membrane protein